MTSRTKIAYRLRQFARALHPRVSAAEQELVATTLAPAERQLFERMARFDQRHCLDVCQTLLRGGYDDPVLLRASLIHDAGKVGDDGRAIPLVYYGLFVVLRRLAPGLYDLAASSGRGVLWPFAIHRQHEARSTRLAAAAGCSDELVATLRDHAARRSTTRTRALRWADDQN